MYIVYGIPNCDTIKKAVSWLQENKIAYTFHNYKKENVSAAKLTSWCKQLRWETFLNKKSATWRDMEPAIQASINTEKAAVTLMIEKTSIIKRPVIEKDGIVIMVGFDESTYSRTFV